jgi:16S rRNA (guanine966-N2)-methyltransferase
LFSALEATRGTLAGARFLDLYAGSGAVGLEALSRGAVHALLVEQDVTALRALRTNVEVLALPGAEVLPERVERLTGRPAPVPAYDVCFADPPYAVPAEVLGEVLAQLAPDWLAPAAVVVVERATRDPDWVWPEPFTALRSRRYGDTTLWYGRAS